MNAVSYHGYRFQPGIIQHGAPLHVGYMLSFRR
jgi:hypothetical protein